MIYFNKNGNQIKAGMDIRIADGNFDKSEVEIVEQMELSGMTMGGI